MPTEHSLVLLRHGYSEWNEKNLFTGWVDVRLTPRGIEEGRNAVGIELNPVYCRMAEQRLQTARRVLPFAADEGETVPDCEKKE